MQSNNGDLFVPRECPEVPKQLTHMLTENDRQMAHNILQNVKNSKHALAYFEAGLLVSGLLG